MKQVSIQHNWPSSWQVSYPYDQLEIYGSLFCRGGAYAYANRQKHTLDLVRKAIKPGSRILDVAAAQGNFSLLLSEEGYDVTWNDLREDLIGYVQLKHEKGKIEFAPGNVFDLGFSECFDLVLITEIIEHVAHPDEFLAKISAIVKPGGFVVMTTPNGGYFLNKLPKFSECADPSQFESIQFKPNSDGHIFLLHLDEIEPLAKKAGLKVLETSIFTNAMTAGHIKTEAILKVVPGAFVNAVESFTSRLPLAARKKIHTSMAVLFQKQVG